MSDNNIGQTITITLIVIIGLISFLIGIVFFIVFRSNGKITSAGEERRYILHIPESYDPSAPTPLVISLHGFADWPARHARFSGWNEVADEYGFIVVYPMGRKFPLRWLAHDVLDENGEPNPDIIFISDLIDHLKQELNIDAKRIYMNGFSNGAGMTHLSACVLGDEIAAVGGVAGAYLLPWEACRFNRSIPAIFFHGTEDKIVEYDGGFSKRHNFVFPSIMKFVEEWAIKNQCDPVASALPSTIESNIIRYTNCEENADVILYSIEGGGHSWPGGKDLPRWIAGHTTHDMNATRLMWNFYERYSLGDSK